MIKQPVLKLDHVSRGYFKKKRKVAGIENITFTVLPGEIVSLVGPSGCGKTTILRLLSNILEPDSGNIYFKNNDISWARKNGLIGFVPQFPALMPNRTIKGNISLSLEIRRIKDLEKTRKIIETLGLSGFENFYPKQLSGGMKQRVSIARALIYDPELLLMDEPFASLDEILRERLDLEIIKIKEKFAKTIVFVTHSVEEAVFISDRIIILSPQPGKIICDLKINLPTTRNIEIKNHDSFYLEMEKVRKILKESNLC